MNLQRNFKLIAKILQKILTFFPINIISNIEAWRYNNMLKKFLYSIAFVSSVLPLYENVQSKQLHALPNYYDGHVTSEQNYRNSIF